MCFDSSCPFYVKIQVRSCLKSSYFQVVAHLEPPGVSKEYQMFLTVNPGVTTMLVQKVFEHTLVIDRSSSNCGKCGYGGYLATPFTDDAPTTCITCGTRWVYSVVEYDTGEPDSNMKAHIENVFPGLVCLGIGTGVAERDEARIWRLFI